MIIRNNKGITLLSLIITVVVLIILTYVTVSISINWSGTANSQNIQTYMLLIQTKCEVLSNEKAIGEIDESGLYGTKIEDVSSQYNGWYKLSQADLNNIGVKDAKEKDGYYFNYSQNDVWYAKGIEVEGKTYYKLSEIKQYIND